MEHSNRPLTLEQLRKMDGEPIWIDRLKRWGIVDCKDQSVYVNGYGDIAIETFGDDVSDFENTLVAYAYQPAHIDREAWKPCEYCGGRKTLYQQTNNTKLFMNTFGKATTLVIECNACPPYADCCMKGISSNSEFKINFCPNCGRPLTDEAWDLLEKRIGG